VIEVLGRRRQSTVSKEQIEDALYAFGEEIESNTIEVYVSRIRRKLGRDFYPHDTRSRLSLGRLRRGRQESGFTADLAVVLVDGRTVAAGQCHRRHAHGIRDQ